MERAAALCRRFELELIGEARGQDRIGELLFLAAGFAARIRIVLLLCMVALEAFGDGELEPVAHVRHLAPPALIEIELALTAAQTLDHTLHLDELRLGVVSVGASGERIFGAPAQVLLELLDLLVQRLRRLDRDIGAVIVVDAGERPVDRFDALVDRPPLFAELGLKARDFVDRVLVEQVFKRLLEPRQAIAFEFGEHTAEVVRSVDVVVEVAAFQRIGDSEGAHRAADATAERHLLCRDRCVSLLEGCPHLALARIAVFEGQSVRPQHVDKGSLVKIAHADKSA